MIIFNLARSATYYTSRALCKLSEESRRSAPASFRPAQRGTFYLENECAVCKYLGKVPQIKIWFVTIRLPPPSLNITKDFSPLCWDKENFMSTYKIWIFVIFWNLPKSLTHIWNHLSLLSACKLWVYRHARQLPPLHWHLRARGGGPGGLQGRVQQPEQLQLQVLQLQSNKTRVLPIIRCGVLECFLRLSVFC